MRTGPEMLFLQASFCTSQLQTPEPMSLCFLLRPAPARTTPWHLSHVFLGLTYVELPLFMSSIGHAIKAFSQKPHRKQPSPTPWQPLVHLDPVDKLLEPQDLASSRDWAKGRTSTSHRGKLRIQLLPIIAWSPTVFQLKL